MNESALWSRNIRRPFKLIYTLYLTIPKFEKADGLVIASPVYFGSANGTLISFLDRLFYSKQFDITMKVGASVAVTRRGGATSTYDELNKYCA